MQAFMDGVGFRVYDIVGYHYAANQVLLQVDALFLRKSHPSWTDVYSTCKRTGGSISV